jgi:hypothetical protein
VQVHSTVATCSRRFSQLSLAHAFKAQGVVLKYPSCSRSGIRWEDGVVVFALEETEVRASAGGFRCLLWSPGSQSRDVGAGPGLKERREHARLAACRGSADGLLVKSGAVVDADAVLTLRVERRRGEYWASWSTTEARVSGEAA